MTTIQGGWSLAGIRAWVVAGAVAASLVGAAADAARAANNSLFAAAMNSITEDELQRHVEVLADDVYEGRAAGSRGGQAASKYVLDQIDSSRFLPGGDNGRFVQSFNNGCRNILALLPGDDPSVGSDVIIVGAHYDHVGYGKNSNSFGPSGQIHNGADDNASGTAVLIEAMQAFAVSGLTTRRTILFAFWDAEENGLVGSRYWISHPTLLFNRVKFDITVDMVGRMREGRLLVLGTRTGYGSRRLLCDPIDDGMSLDFSWEISENSDHWPFLERGVPIALLHTGLHSDYHRPTDDVEKINRAGMGEVSRYLFASLVTVGNAEELPRFRSAGRRETESMRRGLEKPMPAVSLASWPVNEPRPRLGITWREDEAEPGSVLLIRVVGGTPAAAAGMEPGDRILEFAGKPFADGAALRAAIHSELDAGRTEIPMQVERRGHVRTVTLTIPSS